MKHLLPAALLLVLPLRALAAPSSIPFAEAVRRHITILAERGADDAGPVATGMWRASIDTRTLRPLRDHASDRVYRKIGAPNGVAFYWDQPLLAAAHAVDAIAGGTDCSRAADACARAFLRHAVDDRGVFGWGNHVYYDAVADRIVRFSGGHHEMRPVTPAWELLWRLDPKAVERHIRTVAKGHVYDAKTGGFSRHDDRKKGCAFLEAGGILVESLCWLHAKTEDPTLLETALKIANYSDRHRGPETGLVVNNPDVTRWDSRVCTTEVGVWANSLLRAARYAERPALRDMADRAVRAYLRYGYDAGTGRYYGQLRIADGAPVTPEQKGYWPRKYADPWNADQWPTHDYPMALADACVTLFETTGDAVFREGIERWVGVVRTCPAPEGRGAYAESYGRAIHFLAHAGRVLKDEACLDLARRLGREACDRLLENGLFQGYPGAHVCTAVDGVGYLCLALLEVESGKPVDGLGFGF